MRITDQPFYFETGQHPSSGRSTLLLVAATAAFLATGLGARGEFADNWWTIDGGGGTSSGAQFTLNGTTGQPDAGVMSGGGYTLRGGFWSIIATLPPRLSISYAAGIVTIYWPYPSSGYVLEQSDSLTTPVWTQVPTQPIQIDPITWCVTQTTAPGPKFYRLKKTIS
jgi:hypothetical protein